MKPLWVIVFLVLYHSFNLTFKGYHLPLKWEWTSFEMKVGGKTIATLPSVIAVKTKEATPIDEFSKQIGRLGYVGRFLAGEWPEWIFHNDTPFGERMYLRAEVIFQYPKLTLPELKTRLLPQLSAWSEYYRKKGITVVFLPVPGKISIEREWMEPKLPPMSLWESDPPTGEEDSRAVYRAVLEKIPEDAVDLYGTFLKRKAEFPNDMLYCPQDSHWSSLGISLAAQTVLERLKSKGVGQVVPELEFVRNASVVEVAYDLLYHMQLPDYFIAQYFPWREPFYRLKDTGAKPSSHRFILAGTSYGERLHNGVHGLGNQIAKALGYTLVDVAKAHARTQGSFKELQQTGFKLQAGDVLLWELPLRELFAPDQEVILLE